nr:hypothetical protein [Escherichia coli]
MSVKIVIKPNTYFDSVSLMSISTRANKLDGVEQAFVAMATEMNKGVLKNLGKVRISTLRNENETFSQLNSITYIGVFLRLVTYSHLP